MVDQPFTIRGEWLLPFRADRRSTTPVARDLDRPSSRSDREVLLTLRALGITTKISAPWRTKPTTPSWAPYVLCNMSHLATWQGKPRMGIDHAVAAGEWAKRTDDLLLRAYAADVGPRGLTPLTGSTALA